MRVKKAVLPVQGLGTRFLPATKVVPKALFPIWDRPIIHHTFDEAVGSGIEQVILTLSRNNQAVEDYFGFDQELERLLEAAHKDDLLAQMKEICNMVYVCSTRFRPNDIPSGLGTSILSAKPLVGNEPFAVLLPNDLIDAPVPCTKSLIAIHELLKSPVIAVTRVPVDKLSTYGNIAYSELDLCGDEKLKDMPFIARNIYRVDKLVQKPDPKKKEHLSDLAIVGRYVITPDIFAVIENLVPGYEGEVQLTDALEELRRSGSSIYAYELDGDYYDTRSRVGFFNACLMYALKQTETRQDILKIINSAILRFDGNHTVNTDYQADEG